MCSMIVCVLLPRFALTVAAGGRSELLNGPAALAPEPGRDPVVGEVSAAAEAFGVRAGMRVGEAMARCPPLRLMPPDPAGVDDAQERLVERLEGAGAGVEPGPPGLAFFEAAGLRRLHGGTLDGVLAATRRAVRAPCRIGAAPSRFAALAAASRARVRRPVLAPAGAAALAAWLAREPVALLALREETAHLVESFERFGIRTLGELARLPRPAVADRFGHPGILAHQLARGRDSELVTRCPDERLEESLSLPESASGPQLERAIGLLVDRLLARRERGGRTMRAVVLSARLVEGGTWRARVVFREALSDARRMRLALAVRLAELPAPADVLRLRVMEFGPPDGDQRTLAAGGSAGGYADAAAERSARLREAVRQARAVAGPEAALRILEVDPHSRVPERRLALAPWDP
jgi:protein ImuB